MKRIHVLIGLDLAVLNLGQPFRPAMSADSNGMLHQVSWLFPETCRRRGDQSGSNPRDSCGERQVPLRCYPVPSQQQGLKRRLLWFGCRIPGAAPRGGGKFYGNFSCRLRSGNNRAQIVASAREARTRGTRTLARRSRQRVRGCRCRRALGVCWRRSFLTPMRCSRRTLLGTRARRARNPSLPAR